jgi:hypothetical protein
MNGIDVVNAKLFDHKSVSLSLKELASMYHMHPEDHTCLLPDSPQISKEEWAMYSEVVDLNDQVLITCHSSSGTAFCSISAQAFIDYGSTLITDRLVAAASASLPTKKCGGVPKQAQPLQRGIGYIEAVINLPA